MTTDLTKLVASPGGKTRIWQGPKIGANYVIGADVAEGKVRDRGTHRIRPGQFTFTRRPDYSAAVVLEMESGMHCATWHGYVDPHEYGDILGALGLHYNTALLVPEVNGPGIAVMHRLVDELRYPHIYESKVWGRESDDPMTGQFGWRTGQQNRPLLIQRIQEFLNTGALLTFDSMLVDELRTLEYDDNGTPRARGKHKDDLVIALGLALQGRYEQLYGTQESPSNRPDNRLSPEDRRIHAIVARMLENGTHDRNRRPPGRSFRGSRRVVRP